MITDVFVNRHPEFDLNGIPNALFVQFFNLFDGYNIGIHSALLDKVEGHSYSSYADEHIRIIVQTEERLCNEIGYETLDKPDEYVNPNWGFSDYRIFKNYVFDEAIKHIEKLSFFEILFRLTEEHLLQEIASLEVRIVEYRAQSQDIKDRHPQNPQIYNGGEEKLKKAQPQLEAKKKALADLRTTINQRLRQHKIQLAYHQGFFQSASEPIIEEKIEKPFWALLDDSKYENVKTDMLEALDLYASNGRDPALYAAKSLESMMKIVCNEKGLTSEKEKSASYYITQLNKKEGGPIIINDERDELTAMFKIRNSHGGHGPGEAPMPALSDVQALRYIHSAMNWINSLSKR